jgi:hypothetical protein
VRKPKCVVSSTEGLVELCRWVQHRENCPASAIEKALRNVFDFNIVLIAPEITLGPRGLGLTMYRCPCQRRLIIPFRDLQRRLNQISPADPCKHQPFCYDRHT